MVHLLHHLYGVDTPACCIRAYQTDDDDDDRLVRFTLDSTCLTFIPAGRRFFRYVSSDYHIVEIL